MEKNCEASLLFHCFEENDWTVLGLKILLEIIES